MIKKKPSTTAPAAAGDLLLNTLSTTGYAVVPMTQDGLQSSIPSHIKALNNDPSVIGLQAFEICSTKDKDANNKRQLVLTFEEQEYITDLAGVKILSGKTHINIKLFDKIANLTTLDPAQIRVSPTYVTRANYRIVKNMDSDTIIVNNVLDNVVSFRKLIDDEKIVVK